MFVVLLINKKIFVSNKKSWFNFLNIWCTFQTFFFKFVIFVYKINHLMKITTNNKIISFFILQIWHASSNYYRNSGHDLSYHLSCSTTLGLLIYIIIYIIVLNCTSLYRVVYFTTYLYHVLMQFLLECLHLHINYFLQYKKY